MRSISPPSAAIPAWLRMTEAGLSARRPRGGVDAMATSDLSSAPRASGSRSFTLNLVVGSIEAPSEGAVAYEMPYDETALRSARADDPEGFVVFRWSNEIIAVPLGNAAPAGEGWKERRIPLTSLTPMRRLIEAGAGRSLASHGAASHRGRGVLVLDRDPGHDSRRRHERDRLASEPRKVGAVAAVICTLEVGFPSFETDRQGARFSGHEIEV